MAAIVAQATVCLANSPKGRAATLISAGYRHDENLNGRTFHSDASADGRFVAFESESSMLTQGLNSDSVRRVFWMDTATNIVRLVSRSALGAAAEGLRPSISADGRYVCFMSTAPIVEGAGGAQNVYLYDTATRIMTLVTRGLTGGGANGNTLQATIAKNGGYVVFATEATNLFAGDTSPIADVYRYEVATGLLWRVSLTATNSQPGQPCERPEISSDGNVVAFHTASPMASGDSGPHTDVYVRNFTTGQYHCASTTYNSAQATSESRLESISGSGRFVAIKSRATNLLPGAFNTSWDVYVRDLQTGVLRLLSRGTDRIDGNGDSFGARLATTGASCTFSTRATNLILEGSFGLIVLSDAFGGPISPISAGSRRVPMDTEGFEYSKLIGDGSLLVFSTPVPIVAWDHNLLQDAHLVRIATGECARISRNVECATLASLSHNYPGTLRHRLSLDGRYFAFSTRLPAQIPGKDDTNATVAIQDLWTGSVRPLTPMGPIDDCNFREMTEDGRLVAFDSRANGLVTGDSDGREDIFVVDTRTGEVVSPSQWVERDLGNTSNYRFHSLDPAGMFIAFSRAVTSGNPPIQQVLLVDLRTQAWSVVTRGVGGALADTEATAAQTSRGAKRVVVESSATNLVSGHQGNPVYRHLYVYERDGLTIRMPFLGVDGLWPNQGISSFSLAGDGEYCVVVSSSTNLGYPWSGDNVYLLELRTGNFRRLNELPDGTRVDDFAAVPNADASVFAVTTPVGMVPEDNNGAVDPYLWHARENRWELVAFDHQGRLPQRGEASIIGFSRDAKTVIFRSASPEYVERDWNLGGDIFLKGSFARPR